MSVILNSDKEHRFIEKIPCDKNILSDIFTSRYNTLNSNTSFNMMIVTKDQKVLILQRSNHFFKNSTDPVHIFPGGHVNKNECIMFALIREFKEETSTTFPYTCFKFNTKCFFRLMIYDKIINKFFLNLIFPTRVNFTSHDFMKLYKETKYTKNPKFLDVLYYSDIFEMFKKTQEFMLL